MHILRSGDRWRWTTVAPSFMAGSPIVSYGVELSAEQGEVCAVLLLPRRLFTLFTPHT